MPEGKQGLRLETSLADRLCSRTRNAQLGELRGLKHVVTRLTSGMVVRVHPSSTMRASRSGSTLLQHRGRGRFEGTVRG